MNVLDVDEAEQPWPSGLDRLRPDDGSAVCALLPGCSEVILIDGGDALRLRWESPQQPDACSLLLWRNLRGWPAGAPYRSVGIEPMVGRAPLRLFAVDRRLAAVGSRGLPLAGLASVIRGG